MTQAQLAELSRLLYSPVTLALYVSAATVLLGALTQNVGAVRADGVRAGGVRGLLTRRVGLTLAWAGVATHVAHEIVRGLAQQRFPLGNMFEVTSLMALVGVAGGLWYVRSRRRDELAGFVMLGGTLVLGLALLMYAEPGPLMPILDTWWRHFHVSLLVGGMGVFAAGFLFTALYLLADTARGEDGRGPGSGAGAAVARVAVASSGACTGRTGRSRRSQRTSRQPRARCSSHPRSSRPPSCAPASLR